MNPDQWDLAFSEILDELRGLLGSEGMQKTYEFGHEPLARVQNCGGVHLIRIDICSGVANSTIVANVVQSKHHAWH